MLCNKKGLAKTSASPGKTQLINHFKIESNRTGRSAARDHWYLVDLPGYGYAVQSKTTRNNWENMIESYIRKRENLVNLFVLIDSRHDPQKIDIEFVNSLGEWGVPFSVVFTKADKNKPGATRRNVEAFLNSLRETWEELPPYFVTSAVDKTGRKEMMEFIGGLNKSFLSTGG